MDPLPEHHGWGNERAPILQESGTIVCQEWPGRQWGFLKFGSRPADWAASAWAQGKDRCAQAFG